jgi:hypothetical protein
VALGRPVEYFRLGNFVVPIYETPSRKQGRVYPGFTARYKGADGEERAWGSSIEVIKAKLKPRIAALASGEADIIVLRKTDKLIYRRVMEIASSIGLSPDEALLQYQRLRQRALDAGVNADQVFTFYTKHHNHAKMATPTPELVNNFIAAKQRAGNSPSDLRDLSTHLGWFAERFACPPRDISADEYDTFFASFQVAPITLKHYHGTVTRFINWAIKSRFLPSDHPGVPPLLTSVQPKHNRQPLIPRDEREKMIDVGDDLQKPAVLIGSYATIRSCELDRASFHDITWSNSTLAVYADDAKTGVSRFIYLVPELISRLQPYRNRTGKISPVKSLSRLWPRLAKKAGIKWRKNGWRKTVLSHLVAYTQNNEGVAAQAGTSVERLKNNYVTAVEFEEGGAWFGLRASDYHPLRPVSVMMNAQPNQSAPNAEARVNDTKIVPFRFATMAS